jgi:arylsulfatase A-like enzyme
MDGKYTRTFRNCKYSAVSEEDFQGERVMMDDRYKLIVEEQTPNDKGYELYDIQNDPAETKNLADEFPEMVEKMAAGWCPVDLIYDAIRRGTWRRISQ